MAGCVLRVSSETFRVDDFLAASSLQPCDVYRRGELKTHKGKLYDRSGFTVVISEADGDDLPGQIRDAVAFLEQNEEEVARLGNTVGTENIVLDFGIWRKPVFTQYSYFPAQLLSLAGRLGVGIELSIYGSDGEEGTASDGGNA